MSRWTELRSRAGKKKRCFIISVNVSEKERIFTEKQEESRGIRRREVSVEWIMLVLMCDGSEKLFFF